MDRRDLAYTADSFPPGTGADQHRRHRVLVAHCWYRSSNPSGENQVVEREVELLRRSGVEVGTLYRHADDLLASGLGRKLRTAFDLHAGPAAIGRLRGELEAHGADLLHVHNAWPQLTYGIFEAARQLGLPCVQTLHNFRLLATNTHLLGAFGAKRPSDPAEAELLARMPAQHGNALINWCYTRALARYWRRGVPQRLVDVYICPSQFMRRRLIVAGIPADRLVVKPHFLDHRGEVGAGDGGYALFVGRLSSEKGVEELCRCWPQTGVPLKVVGSGPLMGALRGLPGIELVGLQDHQHVLRLMEGARFLVMNSTWYETFGLVLIEALASGTPCLVPDHGPLTEIIADGVTGRVFGAGDLGQLVAKAGQLWEEAPAMRAACRADYQRRYTPESNRQRLLEIYALAAGRAQRAPSGALGVGGIARVPADVGR